MKRNPILAGLINAIGVVVYVFVVVFLMSHAESVLGPDKALLAPMTFLLLFVVSAAITGFLIIGQPIMLFIENKKSEAMVLFLYNVGWLILFLVLVVLVQVLIRL